VPGIWIVCCPAAWPHAQSVAVPFQHPKTPLSSSTAPWSASKLTDTYTCTSAKSNAFALALGLDFFFFRMRLFSRGLKTLFPKDWQLEMRP